MTGPDPLCPLHCTWEVGIRADERERIYATLAEQGYVPVSMITDEWERIVAELDKLEDVAQTRWRDEANVYWEGARDAYDQAAQIVLRGGKS